MFICSLNLLTQWEIVKTDYPTKCAEYFKGLPKEGRKERNTW